MDFLGLGRAPGHPSCLALWNLWNCQRDLVRSFSGRFWEMVGLGWSIDNFDLHARLKREISLWLVTLLKLKAEQRSMGRMSLYLATHP